MYTVKKDPFSSHSKIANLIKLNLKAGKILDVGCSFGFIGSLLPQKTYSLYGIDSDQKSLISAKKYYQQVECLDIERSLPNFDKKFDLIIFADILEHLKDPDKVLNKYLKFGKSNRLVIISIPNVANIVTRLLLLFGHFNYYERGICDKTHLRFFTLSSIKQLLKNANLKILKLDATPLPLSQITPLANSGKPLFIFYALLNLLAVIWKRLFAYQFILLAKKK